MADTWQVRIPAKRWMAGVEHFTTKNAALAFIQKWNDTEKASGYQSLDFVRVPGTKIFTAWYNYREKGLDNR